MVKALLLELLELSRLANLFIKEMAPYNCLELNLSSLSSMIKSLLHYEQKKLENNYNFFINYINNHTFIRNFRVDIILILHSFRFCRYRASAIKVFFKNRYYLSNQRDELYGTSDMISNIGGALGLFTGFALVSLAEIIYFLSIKIIDNYRRYHHWSGPKFVSVH